MNIGISTASYYPLETESALEEIGKSGRRADCPIAQDLLVLNLDAGQAQQHQAQAERDHFIIRDSLLLWPEDHPSIRPG